MYSSTAVGCLYVGAKDENKEKDTIRENSHKKAQFDFDWYWRW